MAARMLSFYGDDWQNELVECPKCHWKGTTMEAGPRYFKEVMDCECPNCDYDGLLAIVNYSVGDGEDQRPRILKILEAKSQTQQTKLPDLGLNNFRVCGDRYRYRSAEQGDVIEVSVCYLPADRNYSSGEMEASGVWIDFTPINLLAGTVGYTFSDKPEIGGLKFPVVEEQHNDPEVLGQIARHFDRIVPRVAELWKSNNQEAVELLSLVYHQLCGVQLSEKALSRIRKAEAAVGN